MENGKDRADDLNDPGRDDGIADRHAKNAAVLQFLKKDFHPEVITKHEQDETRQRRGVGGEGLPGKFSRPVFGDRLFFDHD
jgi:hypothetical protein